MRLLSVSHLELRKSKKKYTKGLILVLILLSAVSLISAYFSAIEGVKSDSRLYVIAGPYTINERHFMCYPLPLEEGIAFVKAGKADVALGNLFIVTGKSKKSLAAADELRTIIQGLFDEELYKRYDSKAFPVLVSVQYVKRVVSYQIGPTKQGEGGQKGEKKAMQPSQTPQAPSVKKEKLPPSVIEENLGAIMSVEEKYVTPRNFSPPNLLGKLIYAFFFILPSYFAVQVFSSSLIEDRATKRLDVLLSTPTSPPTILMGKFLPYFVISIVSVVTVSIALGKSIAALVYVIPIILFFSSLQAFFAINSRSYKEMTFFVISTSLFVTAYIFIPAIFAGTIPVSKVSPITLMLASFEGDKISARDYIFSTFQFYAMAAVLYLIAAKSMNPEIAHSSRGIPEKGVLALSSLMGKEWHAFVLAIAAIPFVFMVEFMLLSVLFVLPPEYSIPVFIGTIAIVEESFKASIVLAAVRKNLSPYVSAIACGTGFFAGEKLIVALNIATQYNTLLLAQFFVLPLVLHISTTTLFAFLRSRPLFAISMASLLHFLYNMAVVMVLA